MNLSPLIRFLFAFCALVALPLALSACAASDDESTPVADSPSPPPAQAETEIIPYIEDPQTQIWRPGYWALGGSGFFWVPGKIIPRPGPTAVWAPARWVSHDYGWSFQQGHWE